MISYEALRFTWWLLLGFLLIGFAVMDGFDLGIAALVPILGRSDQERRTMINTIGPVWEGNQVWFILGGGTIFAAWPLLYAVSFSGFYLAMFIALCGFILRPVSFKYRSKSESKTWRSTWDICMMLSGFIPALILGVAMGNVLQGVPFYFDMDLRVFYTGGFFELLNPFALLCGVVSVLMMTMHGASFLIIKTEGALQQRSRSSLRLLSILLIIVFVAAGFWVVQGIEGYQILNPARHSDPSNPLHFKVTKNLGAWMINYVRYPALWLFPSLTVVSALFASVTASHMRPWMLFIATAFSVLGVVATAGISLYPFLLPSSTHPAMSLTVWNASSSALTLGLMLFVTVVFIPIILFYTGWVYRVMRGKVTELLY